MAKIITVNALQFIVDKAIDALSNVDVNKTKVVWFGHNVYIDIIQKALISRGKRIHYVIDNNADKWGMILEDDLVVFPVNQIANNYKENVIFLISSRFEAEMRQQLLALGVRKSQIITLPSREESEAMAQNFLLKQTGEAKRIELRDMQLIMLDTLKVFRDFCEANELRYFLAAGTLLGAIRHKGFIPWDDDADVYLPYDDYRKFIDAFPDGGRYEVVNWKKNTNYVFDVAKLVDNETLMIHGGYPVKWLQGIGICVIPLSGYPEEKGEFEQKKRANELMDLKWYWYQNARDVISDELQDLRHDICKFKYSMPFDGSPLTGRAHLMHKPMWAVPQSVFAETIQVEFEGELFSAPKGYDYYLKQHYGNYMQIPSVKERDIHNHLPFLKRLNERLQNG